MEETSVRYAVPPGAVREPPPPIAIASWSSWPWILYTEETVACSVSGGAQRSDSDSDVLALENYAPHKCATQVVREFSDPKSLRWQRGGWRRHRRRRAMASSALGRFARATAFAVPVAITLNDLVCGVTWVEGSSMEPALNASRNSGGGRGGPELVLLDKASVRLQGLQRGDVVVSIAPDDPARVTVKRLIALEGDWLRDTRGKMVHVPRGRCWLEGDNRDGLDVDLRDEVDLDDAVQATARGVSDMRDSNHFGPVPVAMLQSRVVTVLWPPSRVGLLPRRERHKSLDIWPDTPVGAKKSQGS